VRETLGAPYYRHRPGESVRYAASKVTFAWHATSADGLLAALGFDPLEARSGLSRWSFDLNCMLAKVDDRSASRRLDQGGVSLEGALFLYGLVRSLRPAVVVETGVAAGVSTAFVGAALIENGLGRLISIDLPPQRLTLDDGAIFDWRCDGVGWAIPRSIRRRLGDDHHLVLEDVRSALPRILAEEGRIDLFIHDDLHTPDHMRWEFELVWPALADGGVLVADDVNHGWLQFIADQGLTTQGRTTVNRLGAVRKPRGGRAAS
jgi:predicted O-methyltransferase YrrM